MLPNVILILEVKIKWVNKRNSDSQNSCKTQNQKKLFHLRNSAGQQNGSYWNDNGTPKDGKLCFYD